MAEIWKEIPEHILQLVDDVRCGRLELTSSEAAPLREWLEGAPNRKAWFNDEIDFDFRIRQCVGRISVPVRLSSRIVANLLSHQRAMGDQERARSIRRQVVARAEAWWRNRRVQFGMGVATGLLALVCLIAIWNGNSRPLIVREPLDAVIVKSIEWFEELMADEDWEDNFYQYMSQYPLDDLIPRKPRRARPFYGNWGVGTVYDLSDSSMAGALLFVVRPSRHFVERGRLPTEPVYVDSRHAVGAGEHNGCVYILVVRGRPQDYQLLFMTSLTDE